MPARGTENSPVPFLGTPPHPALHRSSSVQLCSTLKNFLPAAPFAFFGYFAVKTGQKPRHFDISNRNPPPFRHFAACYTLLRFVTLIFSITTPSRATLTPGNPLKPSAAC